MRTVMMITFVGAAAIIASGSEAQAQSCRYGGGGYRGGYSSGGISIGFYGGRGISYGASYHRAPRRSWYHDTSHYDYHPTQVIPHRNHYHVIPGHYDLHRTGHWHHR